MKLRITPGLAALLRSAQGDSSLPGDLQAAAAAAAAAGAGGSVDWDTVKALVQHARQRDGDAVPSLEQLCAGGGVAFPPPRKPAGKPAALQAHLDAMRARLEQQQYDRMVRDVTQEERRAEARRQGGLVTYKQQISFGIHVLAMMGAFYAFGHVAGMALTPNRAVHPFVGLVFMIGALLLETVLYVIRTTVPPKLHQAAAARATAARVARQQEAFKAEMAAEAAAAAAGAAGKQGTARVAAGKGGSGAGGAAAPAPKPAAAKKGD